MSERNIPLKKAASFHAWLETGAEGKYEVFSGDPSYIYYDIQRGNIRTSGTVNIPRFIGGLMYHEALQLEARTGYNVDASVLVDQVVAEFTSLQEAA